MLTNILFVGPFAFFHSEYLLADCGVLLWIKQIMQCHGETTSWCFLLWWLLRINPESGLTCRMWRIYFQKLTFPYDYNLLRSIGFVMSCRTVTFVDLFLWRCYATLMNKHQCQLSLEFESSIKTIAGIHANTKHTCSSALCSRRNKYTRNVKPTHGYLWMLPNRNWPKMNYSVFSVILYILNKNDESCINVNIISIFPYPENRALQVITDIPDI